MKVLFLTMVVLFAHRVWAVADTQEDFQLWYYNSIAKKLNEKTKLSVDGELRFGDKASTCFLWYIQALLRRDFTPWFALEPGYRHLYFLRPRLREWQALYEPFFDVHFKTTWKGWVVTSRNRTSYLFFDHLPNAWQFRTRLLAKAPWKWGRMGLTPVIFDEVFFREFAGFEQNRIGFGGCWEMREKLQSTLVYMLRHRKLIDQWRYQNVLWLLLNYTF